MFCISSSRAGCTKNASKNIIPSESYEFFKSGSIQLLYILHTRANFKSRYLKTILGTFLEKTIQARGLKLGSYVLLMNFYNLSLNSA